MLTEFERNFKKITGLNFIEFYKNYKPKLIWHLSKWTKSLDIAEDYADEAFIQALNKIDTYNYAKGAKVHTWLYTIAENIVKKAYREQQRIPSISIDKEYAEHSTLSSFIPYNDGKRELEIHNLICKKTDIIKSVIESLPKRQEKYKKVLIMRELQNMSYNSIAEQLSLNLSTIKSQIKKGREIVFKKVEKKFKYLDEHGV